MAATHTTDLGHGWTVTFDPAVPVKPYTAHRFGIAVSRHDDLAGAASAVAILRGETYLNVHSCPACGNLHDDECSRGERY